MEWKHPDNSIVKCKYSVIYYEEKDYDGDYVKEINIFSYDGITGTFKSRTNGDRIKYKDILKWFPLPDID